MPRKDRTRRIQSHEWYTSKEFMEIIHEAIHEFDMDACCPNADGKGTHVKAKRYLTSCLDIDWQGVVWMNPPYNNLRNHYDEKGVLFVDPTPGVSQFLQKAIHECFVGNCDAVLVLLPSNHEVGWWMDDVKSAPLRMIINLTGRVMFEYGGTDPNPPLSPNRQYSLILYVSHHADVDKIKELAGKLYKVLLDKKKIHRAFTDHISLLLRRMAEKDERFGSNEFTVIDDKVVSSNIVTENGGFDTPPAKPTRKAKAPKIELSPSPEPEGKPRFEVDQHGCVKGSWNR